MMKTKKYNSEKLLNGIEKSIEGFAWIKLMLSPLLSDIVVGACIYWYFLNTIALIVGLIITFIGLLFGIYFANRIKKKYGAVNHLSKLLKD